MSVTLLLENIGVNIEKFPNGVQHMAFIDQQSGIKVLVPLDQQAADAIMAGLRGITLARQLPPDNDGAA